MAIKSRLAEEIILSDDESPIKAVKPLSRKPPTSKSLKNKFEIRTLVSRLNQKVELS